MSDMEKDFSVEIKVRNGRLLSAIRKKFGNVAEMKRQTGITDTMVYRLLSMKMSPLNRSGKPSKTAEMLMSSLGMRFEELWPNELGHNTMENNTAEVFMDADEVQSLIQKSPHEMLEFRNTIGALMNSLEDRQRDIIERRMDGQTLQEIADDYGLNRQTIKVVEYKAIKRMQVRAYRLGIREMF